MQEPCMYNLGETYIHAYTHLYRYMTALLQWDIPCHLVMWLSHRFVRSVCDFRLIFRAEKIIMMLTFGRTKKKWERKTKRRKKRMV